MTTPHGDATSQRVKIRSQHYNNIKLTLKEKSCEESACHHYPFFLQNLMGVVLKKQPKKRPVQLSTITKGGGRHGFASTVKHHPVWMCVCVYGEWAESKHTTTCTHTFVGNLLASSRPTSPGQALNKTVDTQNVGTHALTHPPTHPRKSKRRQRQTQQQQQQPTVGPMGSIQSTPSHRAEASGSTYHQQHPQRLFGGTHQKKAIITRGKYIAETS